jgi:hypothetical protein
MYYIIWSISPAKLLKVSIQHISCPVHMYLLLLCRIYEVKSKDYIFFNWYSGGWSPIGSTRHCGHQWLIVPAPGAYDDGEIGGMIGRGNRSTRRKTCPNAALSTTNPTCCPDANPGRRGGKPATNRLSYGTASRIILTKWIGIALKL